MNDVNIISLGCSKNLVDTELLLKQFEKAGYRASLYEAEKEAEIVVINTCGFIGDAKEESVNTILEQIGKKKAGKIRKVLVMGCLSQRYKSELETEIPEVDAYFGKFDWEGILKYLGKTYDNSVRNQRILTTPSHYAYLKIAEGCNRRCSYCAIPIMTGKYKSRELDEILEECRLLAREGVKEILVMAQDLTYYGTDLYGKNRLADLVDKIADIEGIKWIKLHYAYPAGFPMELLSVMKKRENVCNYLDIALQHCSDPMLKKMRRGIDKEQTIRLIRKIRREVPGIYLRTTLMTGHPGEKEEDFKELCDFVREMKFERLGVFPYSHEEDTYCDKHYQDDVPEKIKKRRAEKIMKIQQKVVEALNLNLLGKVVQVLIDREEEGYFVGRTEHDSPEVDPEVIVKSDYPLRVGEFYRVKICGTYEYDLEGKVVPDLKM